jgi:hypothetical protein
MADDVKAKITQTEDLPATRSICEMPSDVSITLENILPAVNKLEMGQEFTATLTTPLVTFPVLFPIDNPDRVMVNIDDALIAAPKMVRITEVDEVALHTADTFVALLEPAGEKGMAEGTKK